MFSLFLISVPLIFDIFFLFCFSDPNVFDILSLYQHNSVPPLHGSHRSRRMVHCGRHPRQRLPLASDWEGRKPHPEPYFHRKWLLEQPCRSKNHAGTGRFGIIRTSHKTAGRKSNIRKRTPTDRFWRAAQRRMEITELIERLDTEKKTIEQKLKLYMGDAEIAENDLWNKNSRRFTESTQRPRKVAGFWWSRWRDGICGIFCFNVCGFITAHKRIASGEEF